VRNGRQMGSFEGHAQRMLTPSPQTPHPPYAPAESNFLSATSEFIGVNGLWLYDQLVILHKKGVI
jgi:hypothetical protein